MADPRAELMRQTMSNFAQLIVNLNKLTEWEVKHCLDAELEKGKDARRGYVKRLHQRYTSLRRSREREKMNKVMGLKGEDKI